MTTPAPDTPPALSGFIALAHPDIIDRYRRGTERLQRRLLDLNDARLDTAFHPDRGVGRWPCRVLMGHLADAELAFVHRMRRVVAEERPVFSAWDENAFIDAGLYGGASGGRDKPVAAFVAVIHTLRAWNAEWLATLGDGAWARSGLHPERGEQTLRTIMNYATWHLEHHAWYLDRKLELLLGPAGT